MMGSINRLMVVKDPNPTDLIRWVLTHSLVTNGINRVISFTSISVMFSGNRPGRNMFLNRFNRKRNRAEKGMMANRKTKDMEAATVKQSSQIKLRPEVPKALI